MFVQPMLVVLAKTDDWSKTKILRKRYCFLKESWCCWCIDTHWVDLILTSSCHVCYPFSFNGGLIIDWLRTVAWAKCGNAFSLFVPCFIVGNCVAATIGCIFTTLFRDPCKFKGVFIGFPPLFLKRRGCMCLFLFDLWGRYGLGTVFCAHLHVRLVSFPFIMLKQHDRGERVLVWRLSKCFLLSSYWRNSFEAQWAYG